MKLFLAVVFIFNNLYAYNDVNASKLVSVYDGDTFKVNIDKYPAIVGKKNIYKGKRYRYART